MSQSTAPTQAQPQSFNQQAGKLRDDFLASQSQAARETVMAAMQELFDAELDKNAIKTGDAVPAFTLPDAHGNNVDILERVKEGPVVLSFYRGGWCPFCNLEFKALQDILPEIKNLGAQLIGISPETPDNTAKTVSEHGLRFDVLSDVGNQVAKHFGLLMYVPESMRPLYAQWGMDVPAANGDESWELPIPATYVIGRDGQIKAHYINIDYTQRMEPAEILAALAKLD